MCILYISLIELVLTMEVIHILIVPLIFLRMSSTTETEGLELNSKEEPKCARLLLFSASQLYSNKTISLGNNEEMRSRFRLVTQEFKDEYFIRVTVRFNCSVWVYSKKHHPLQLKVDNQRIYMSKDFGPVNYVRCLCGRPSPIIDECPSQLECPYDESNDISKAGQCGRGYQESFCGICMSGYLVIPEGKYYPSTSISGRDPQFRSVTMGKGCHLWIDGKRINTGPPGNVYIGRTKSIICNCSASESPDEDVFLSDSTTPTPSKKLTTPTQQMNLTTYLPVTLAVLVLLIGSVGVVFKFRGQIRLIFKNTMSDVKLIPPNEIEVLNEVASGRFGVIRLAEWKSIKCMLKSAAQRTVISSRETECEMYSKLLFQELQILRHIGENTNIVKLIGTVNGLEFETCLVLEYCQNGDLKSYLRNIENQARFVNIVGVLTKLDETELPTLTVTSSLHLDRIRLILNCDSDSDIFSTVSLMKWFMEIASGMEFPGQRSVVHVDLAARNILLTIDNIAKIADFGLSKILAAPNEEFVQIGDTDEDHWLPLAWIAPEGSTGRFSIKSDVWSFGITLWEIYSLGEVPYSDIPDVRLLEVLRNGYRMSKPTYASNDIYEKLLEYWKIGPNERPCFDELKLFFESEIMLTRDHLHKVVNDDRKTPVSCTIRAVQVSSYVDFEELS